MTKGEDAWREVLSFDRMCLFTPQEYAAIGGDASFADLSAKLAFGADSAVIRQKRISTVQSLSGTGSLRVLPPPLPPCAHAAHTRTPSFTPSIEVCNQLALKNP